MNAVRVKRVYEPAEAKDGARVLVDRLWPRGLKKEDAALDRWLRDVAPSPELRRWFGHADERWPEFKRRYEEELALHPEPVSELRHLAEEGPLTLLFAARDHEHNNAVVLCDLLLNHRPG